MNSKTRPILYGFIILSLVQFACASLTPSINETKNTSGHYGPQISLTEHQAAVFESIMSQLKDNYIYYETSNVDWDALRQKYSNEINKGLSTTQFDDLMTQFDNEFPTGEVRYVTRQERIDADLAVATAQYVGIGAFISFQAKDTPHVVILDVVPDSPAEKAGLRAHDSIYAVDGGPVTETEGANVVQRIRGEAGTKVTLTVQSPGKNKRDIEITRAPINAVGNLKTDELSDQNIGYILMPTANSDTISNDVAKALDEFSKNKQLKGIILDLRISYNNSSFPLENLLTYFLDKTSIDIYSRTKTQTFDVVGQDVSGSQKIPLVVLVGENTSGSAEIFAAAIQETGRGIVIGSETAGNIEAISGFPLPDGGQILMASTSFRVGADKTLGLEGLKPKVQVEAGWDQISDTKDPVLQKAIDSFEVQP